MRYTQAVSSTLATHSIVYEIWRFFPIYWLCQLDFVLLGYYEKCQINNFSRHLATATMRSKHSFEYLLMLPVKLMFTNSLVFQFNTTQNNNSQSFIDALVVLTALPSLTILALLLEANTRGNWLSQPETRYTVFGLGFTLVIICMAIAMYVTSRIGGKMWSGAIPSDGSHPAYSYYVSFIFWVHCDIVFTFRGKVASQRVVF